MTDLKTLTVDGLRQRLQNSARIAIVPHKSPDGDAIGSSLALFHFLRELKKEAYVMVEDAPPLFLSYLSGIETIMVYDTEPTQIQGLLPECDMIFCLDYSQFKRSGKLESYIRNSSAIKVMIDHHPNPEAGFDFYQHETASSSTCELIYEFMEQMSPGYNFSKPVAECLYTGLMTDTGCFRHALRPNTLFIAGKLLGSGISYEYIVSKIFDTNTPEKLGLIGFTLNHKLQVQTDFRTAIISLSFEESEKLGIKKGDTEGLVNYTLSIDNMVMGAFFHERDKGKTKVSLRSKGLFDVNLIAQKYFLGGGHRNAAGGEFNG